MNRVLVLIGDGEHARVVAEAAAALGWTVEHSSVVPGEPEATTLARRSQERPDDRFHIAVGAIPDRIRIAAACPDLPWATIVHPTAWISPSATLGAGCFIGPRAVLHTGCQAGSHVIVNSGVIVEHDAMIGELCHLCPGAVLGGGVRIGRSVLVGLNACVRDHLSVGDRAVIGMGAAVIDDIAPETVVGGVPARPLRRRKEA